MPKKAIQDTVVLITGASHGIGLETARAMASQGYRVIATSHTLENRPELLALQADPRITVATLDVTSPEPVIQDIIRSFGDIDILINNAGVGLLGSAESQSLPQVQHVLDINVLGVMKVTNAVLPQMRERNMGFILFINSVVGPLFSTKQWAYGGSKAMIQSYAGALRHDLEANHYDIQVSNINPGPVVTHFEQNVPVGDRFVGGTDPYPQSAVEIESWRAFMQKGRAIQETVDTILRVLQTEKPLFWNPTEGRVRNNLEHVYHDASGESWAAGPSFAPAPSLSTTAGTLFDQVTGKTSADTCSTTKAYSQ